MKLDDYLAAYDRTHNLAGGAPDWGTLRKKVRRSLARPALELTGQVIFLFACLALGIWGHWIGYLLALGALCFIPQYVGSLRAQIASIKDLSSEVELQQHLDKEARRRMAGAVLGLVFYAGLALLFLGTAAVAAWMGKDFRPGLGAGLVLVALSAYAGFVRLPRASREIATLGSGNKNPQGREEDYRGN
jgi:fatty acid desaturase